MQKQSPEVFLKISQTSQENNLLEFFFMKLQAFSLQVFIKETPTQVLSVKFAKLLRIPTMRNIYKRLLLEVFYKKARS